MSATTPTLHPLWVLLGAESARDGYALKPSPWEGPGEYQRVVYPDGRDVLHKVDGEAHRAAVAATQSMGIKDSNAREQTAALSPKAGPTAGGVAVPGVSLTTNHAPPIPADAVAAGAAALNAAHWKERNRLETANAALVAALELMYSKWENGDPCYQNGDVDCDSLGNAFRLSDDEEKSVLAALKAAKGEA